VDTSLFGCMMNMQKKVKHLKGSCVINHVVYAQQWVDIFRTCFV